jgi:hypothetical protein
MIHRYIDTWTFPCGVSPPGGDRGGQEEEEEEEEETEGKPSHDFFP